MLHQSLMKRRPPVGRRFAVALLSSVAVASVVLDGYSALAASANQGDPAGTIRSVAGRTINYRQGGFSGDDGLATEAQLYNPRAVAFGQNGDVFIADALNQRVRKIDANGVITTVAGSAAIDPATQKPAVDPNTGNPTVTFDGDGGPATSAHLWEPHGVAVDSHGNLYISDSRNNRIRMVDASTQVINTIAGSDQRHGSPEGPAATAILKIPKSLFMGPSDVLYIADSGDNEIVKIDLKVTPLVIAKVAGTSQAKNYGGDEGPAIDANLSKPEGLAVMSDGTVYISDNDNNLVRKVTPDGKIHTIAGDTTAAAANAMNTTPLPPSDSAGDGGPATAAHLNGPRGVAADSLGNVYIAEEAGARIRRIDPSGIITTIAGDGVSSPQGQNGIKGDPGPSPAAEAEFNTMHDLNIDSKGNLWIADSKNNRVRVVFEPANAPASTAPTPPPA